MYILDCVKRFEEHLPAPASRRGKDFCTLSATGNTAGGGSNCSLLPAGNRGLRAGRVPPLNACKTHPSLHNFPGPWGIREENSCRKLKALFQGACCTAITLSMTQSRCLHLAWIWCGAVRRLPYLIDGQGKVLRAGFLKLKGMLGGCGPHNVAEAVSDRQQRQRSCRQEALPGRGVGQLCPHTRNNTPLMVAP